MPLPDTHIDKGDRIYGIVRIGSIDKVKKMFGADEA
jgi:Trk K+ transport system NAD-binding subunit